MASLRSVSVLVSLVVLGSGMAAIAAPQLSPVSPSPVSPSVKSQVLSQATGSRIPFALARRMQRDLSNRLNVAPETLQIVQATPSIWPDQCLGLGRPNERCKGGTVEGWRVQIASRQQQWFYRSDRNGQQLLRLEPLDGAADFARGEFTQEVSQRLLKKAAQDLKQPVRRLQILEVQPAVWDGCLGIFEPDRFCTQQAVAGFRVILTPGQSQWVYHLSEDGSRLAQNRTASGGGSQLLTSFFPLGNPSPDLEPQILFQSQLSGDLTGSVQKTILATDGTLYREQFRPGTPGNQPTRTVLRKLSQREVDDFQSLLQTQRFLNLNRMRYLTQAAFADYPTTRLETSGAAVEYIDLAQDRLPQALQAVIKAWNRLEK